MSNQITPESYTALSEDLLADIQEALCVTDGWPETAAAVTAATGSTMGQWVAVANSVTHVAGKTLSVHAVCDNAATAQQITDLLNYQSVHAPTTW
jgi:hypothetical protein